MGRQFSRAFERVQNVSFAPVNLPRRWRANDALTYRHNPPANERPSHGPYPRWMSERRRAWWTLNTPSKFRDSSNFFGRALSLARLFRSIAFAIDRARRVRTTRRPLRDSNINYEIMQNSRFDTLLFAIVARLFIYIYMYTFIYIPLEWNYLSFANLVDLIGFFSGKGNNEIDQVRDGAGIRKSRPREARWRSAPETFRVTSNVQWLIFTLEKEKKRKKERSPRFLIYSKNYMQLPPPPSAPASASRR